MYTKGNFEGSALDSKFFTMKPNFDSFKRIIYHCPDCFDLPLLKINSDMINASCECDKNHKYENISLNVLYQKLLEVSINLDQNNLNKNIICNKCNKPYEKKENLDDLTKALDGYGYCHGCEKIICSSCLKSHEDNEKKKDPMKHKLVPLDKYVNFCPLHRNRYSAYCFDCKKNTCVKCSEHRQHKKYHFDDYLLLDDDVKKYKKSIINLRSNCENLENQLNLILDKIRNDFHNLMQRHINVLILNEFLLDSYQTNQFNYFYLQNVLNNFPTLDIIQKQLSDKDIKSQIIEMIQNINISELSNISNTNNKIEQTKQGELLNVTQPQFTNKFNNIDYNKDTVNPTFKIENENEQSINNNNKSIEKKMEMTDSKMESIQMKNNENNNIKENNNCISDINKNNISKKSLKESIKKENGLDIDLNNLNINVNQSYDNEIKREEISLNDINIKSLKIGNIKISCEFVGKNYSSMTYKLKELPNNIETAVEIKNNSNIPLPKGCYLFDENNCGSLMLLDNVINCLEPGKTCYKKLKFDIYIYSKGSYNLKLSIKDPNGNYISSNKFDFSLIIE